MAKRSNGESTTPKSGPAVIEFETGDDGAALPRIPDSPPFLLTHHVDRWIVLGGRLVPFLSKFAIVAGSNRVEVRADGSIGFADARAKLEKDGRKIIPQDWGPLTAANGKNTYVQAVQSTQGLAHLSAWESYSPGSSTTYSDTDAYAEWLESLVTDGKVVPCTADLARQMLAESRRKLGVAEAVAAGLNKGSIESATSRRELLRKEVDVLEKYIASVTKGVAAARKKGPAMTVSVEG